MRVFSDFSKSPPPQKKNVKKHNRSLGKKSRRLAQLIALRGGGGEMGRGFSLMSVMTRVKTPYKKIWYTKKVVFIGQH